MSGFPKRNLAKRLRSQMEGSRTRSTIVPNWDIPGAGPSSEQLTINPRFENTGRTDTHNLFEAASPSAFTTADEYPIAGPSNHSAASSAQDDASDCSSATIRPSPQRAQVGTPTKPKFSDFRDAGVDDEDDEMHPERSEDGFDPMDYIDDDVAEAPVASERFRIAMDAQRGNIISARGEAAAITATPLNRGVYVANAGGAVADRVIAQDNILEDNGASSAIHIVERRAALADDSADGDAQPNKGTVLGESVSESRRRNSASNAFEEAPRARGKNARRGKAGPTTRLDGNVPGASQPIDIAMEGAGPRTRARARAAGLPSGPTAVAPTAPAPPTVPANPSDARVRTRVQPARAARAKPASVTRGKTTTSKGKGKARASAPSPEPIPVVARANRRRALAAIKKEESIALLQTPRLNAKAPAAPPSAPEPPAKPARRTRQKAPVAPPANTVRTTRQRAGKASAAPPPPPAPPAEPADPTNTRTLRSKRAYGLEVPQPKPRTRRTAQQADAPALKGKGKGKATAGQKRRRDDDDDDDDDDVDEPGPSKRRPSKRRKAAPAPEPASVIPAPTTAPAPAPAPAPIPAPAPAPAPEPEPEPEPESEPEIEQDLAVFHPIPPEILNILNPGGAAALFNPPQQQAQANVVNPFPPRPLRRHETTLVDGKIWVPFRYRS